MDLDYYELYANEQDAKYKENMLAIIVDFDTGDVVVSWAGNTRSTVVYHHLDDFKKVSLTGDRVLLQYDFEPDYKYHNPQTFTRTETIVPPTKN